MTGTAPSLAVKLAVDLAMAVLFLICLGFRLTAETTHEWAGVVLFALLGAHTWFNRGWYRSLFKGTYAFRRVVNTTVNLCLLSLMLLLLIGGLMNAHLLRFMEFKGGMQYREWHTFAAHWGLVLVGMHIGMHWTVISGMIRKWTGTAFARPVAVVSLRSIGLALVCFGVWASFDREMGSKLFLGFGFDYWNPERPAVLFYCSTFSIMCLYAFVTHSVMRLTKSVTGRLARPVRPIAGETSPGIRN